VRIDESIARRMILLMRNDLRASVRIAYDEPAQLRALLAAVDRLVHHSTIFELNVESYRRRAATQAPARTDTKPKAKKD
jgi:hypothetical protein